MTDIVERLRGEGLIAEGDFYGNHAPLCFEAATEIEMLRGLIKGLLTVIDVQEPYVTTHLFRTGERLDESEVLPLHAIVAEARHYCD